MRTLFFLIILGIFFFLPMLGGDLTGKVAVENPQATLLDEPAAPFPIPTTLLLFASGIVGLIALNRKSRK